MLSDRLKNWVLDNFHMLGIDQSVLVFKYGRKLHFTYNDNWKSIRGQQQLDVAVLSIRKML